MWCLVLLLWRTGLAVLQVDACMVATGRVPNTKTLGLENMGIETNRGFVQASFVALRQPLSRSRPDAGSASLFVVLLQYFALW